MAPKKGRPTARAAFIWDHPAANSRPALAPLDRAAIVRAAVHLADTKGLEGVSLRKVGAVLEAGPMRLYGYLATKDDLFELMVDEVYGEMVAAGPIRGNWRKVLRSTAKRTRDAAREHRWFIDLLARRTHLGPNSLAYLEASLAALTTTSGFENVDAVMQALGTVNAYVIGFIRSEANSQRTEFERGADPSERRTARGTYIQRMIASGRFPTLSKVAREASHPSPDSVFEKGLDCVLDGIAVRILG